MPVNKTNDQYDQFYMNDLVELDDFTFGDPNQTNCGCGCGPALNCAPCSEGLENQSTMFDSVSSLPYGKAP